MNVEHLRRRFLRNLIVAVWVALSILLVSSGGPFGFSDEGVEAQTTSVNFLKNLTVPGDGAAPHDADFRLLAALVRAQVRPALHVTSFRPARGRFIERPRG